MSNQTRKNRLTLRGAVGVWNCESSDRIKGCDGACIHAVGFLAGAGGWSITNVAAFSISYAISETLLFFVPALKRPGSFHRVHDHRARRHVHVLLLPNESPLCRFAKPCLIRRE